MHTKKQKEFKIHGIHTKLSAILFDLDDTLIDRATAFRGWATQLAYKHSSQSQSALETSDDIETICALDNWGFTNRLVLFKQIQERFGWELWPKSYDWVNCYYTEILPFIDSSCGVTKLLFELRQRSIPFGVVTNGGQHQIDKANIVELNIQAQFILASDFHSSRKPDSVIFELALSKFNLAPDEVVFVGDQPAVDIVGAKSVHMPIVWVSHGRESSIDTACCADITVKELDELQLN